MTTYEDARVIARAVQSLLDAHPSMYVSIRDSKVSVVLAKCPTVSVTADTYMTYCKSYIDDAYVGRHAGLPLSAGRQALCHYALGHRVPGSNQVVVFLDDDVLYASAYFEPRGGWSWDFF